MDMSWEQGVRQGKGVLLQDKVAGCTELQKVEPRALVPAVEASAVYLPITLKLVLFIG